MSQNKPEYDPGQVFHMLRVSPLIVTALEGIVSHLLTEGRINNQHAEIKIVGTEPPMSIVIVSAVVESKHAEQIGKDTYDKLCDVMTETYGTAQDDTGAVN